MIEITGAEYLIYKMLFEELGDAIKHNKTKEDIFRVIDEWLIKFKYKKEKVFFDKVLYICKEQPSIPFGDGIDVFILGKDWWTSLRGKKYRHWFKDEKIELLKEDEEKLNLTLFTRN